MPKGDGGGLFRGTWTQVFAATSGTLLAITEGITYGWTAPVIPYLISDESHIKTNLLDAEWLESIAIIGALCGLPATIYSINTLGCKKSLLLTSVITLLTWLSKLGASRMWHLYVARFFLGVCCNMSVVAGPMYIAEIADQKIRGFLSSIPYLMMLFGFVVVYSVAPFTPFYVMPLISSSIIIVELATFSFMPESPYYHIKHQRFDEAEKALQYFRPGRDFRKDIEEIINCLEKQKSERGRIKDLFLVRSNRKPTIIMAVLNAGQHMAGLSVILMNLHLILRSANSIYMSASTVGIVFSVIMLVAASVASLKVDQFGRRPLLIFSSLLTAVCLLTLAIYFHFKNYGYDVSGASWIPVVSVMVYAAAFKTGLGIIPIIITAEVFSSKLKALGMTMADSMYSIGGLVSIQIYQWLVLPFGMYTPMYVFSMCSFGIAIFTYLYIPETKGKTLEEIQTILRGEDKEYRREKVQTEEMKRLEET